MTPDEVERLVQQEVRGDVPVRILSERQGEAFAYLGYSIEDNNRLTIWHTEVPEAMRHLGVGTRLVEQALALSKSAGATLRLVCPFAKNYLARHPEVSEMNQAAKNAVIEPESLTSGSAFS
jgi:predicted GNAT family acetyltransferase